MKIEGAIFLFVGIFLGGTDIVYWFTSHDPTGTTALALGTGLGLLVATYLLVTSSRIGLQPEDMDDADISDGAGEIGFFSPYSWAPLWCAASAAVIFAGVVFGWWLVFLGVGVAVPAVGSMIFEYHSEDAPL